MSRFTRPALLAVSLLLVSFPLAAAGVEGRWKGTIDVPGTKLEVEIDLEPAPPGWKGDITIPAQGARDLPLEAIAVEGRKASFRIAGVPGSPAFEGMLSEDGQVLSGTFSQGGGSFPFTLSRAPVEDRATRLQGLDALIASALKDWEVPGLAMAIVADGEVIYAKGHGLRDVARKLPMTADTLLPIGSATKAFTTFALGTLVDEGKVAWDDPVSKHLPWFRLSETDLTAQMTVRDLVTHRSGLPRHDLVWYNNQELTRREIVERLATLEKSAPIRSRFQYNNLMYLTAGFLIEELTGKPWEDAVRERILAPLGMSRTNFADAVSAADPDHARPYRTRKHETSEIPFREVGNMGPAGSINSSVNEMTRWVRMLLGDGTLEGTRLVQASTWRELRTPQVAISALPQDPELTPASYAHGWFVDAFRGHLRTHHGGNIDGFSALVTLFPNDGIGIVALANGNGTPLPGLMTLHAAEMLFDSGRKDWNAQALARNAQFDEAEEKAEAKKTATRVPNTKPSHRLEEYAGDYEAPGYGRLRIEKTGPSLVAVYNGIATPLEHWHYDVFNGLRSDDPTFEDTRFQFRSDVNGNVAELVAPFEPFVDPIVFTRRPAAWMTDPAALGKFEGEYVLGPQAMRVHLRGASLVLSIQGQRPYELVPAADGWFDLSGLSGFRLRFLPDGSIELQQPNGLFTATKKEG